MSEHMDAATTPDDHPSQAEGDVGDDQLSGEEPSEFGSAAPTTESDGTPVENPSGG
jgi:hypothetical protein